MAQWVERMTAGGPATEDLLPSDAVHETILPIPKRQMAEQLPVLMATAEALGEWARAQPRGVRVKRSLGTHEFAIGGRRAERSIITFSLWRLQCARPLAVAERG